MREVMSAEARFAALELTLPPPPQAGGNYVPYQRHGDLVYLAGVISISATAGQWTGQLGIDRSVLEGQAAARICALNAMSVLRSVTGSLDDVAQILTLSGYVNAVSGFDQSPMVINGASDLLVEIFGEAGRHARAAVAVAGLPKNATVEIQLVAALKPGS